MGGSTWIQDDDIKKSVSVIAAVDADAELKHVYYICRCVLNPY